MPIPNDKKPTALERRLQAYPPPLYLRYVKAYVAYTGDSESNAVSGMIKKFFDEMPQQEKDRLLRRGNNNY